MSTTILPRLISCDEAGFTGNRMLDGAQPYFAYASVDLALDEAGAIVNDLRSRHHLQMGELKAAKLLKRPRGRAIVAEVLERIEGRYIATLYDKRLSLAAKFFEYIYEPVLQRNNMLFYHHNLHRFVATFLYMQMLASGEGAEELAVQFERFMRSLDPADAPALFGASDEEHFDMLLGPILRFARGYNVAIARETRNLQLTGDNGKWVLDLTISAVTDHLRNWAERHPLLEVVCDDSKPLRALAGIYDVMVDRPDPVYMEAFGKRVRLTWNMAKPISFVSSLEHAAVQLADLVAGTAVAVAASQGDETYHQLAEAIQPHLSEECILPDFDIIDLAGDEAPVNMFVLEELANRADRGMDPLVGMEEVYAVAKATLPDFRRRVAVGERASG
jgi:hypothetical protein